MLGNGLDRPYCLAQGNVRRKVERNHGRRKLPLAADEKRPGRLGIVRYRIKRHLPAACALQIDVPQPGRIVSERRLRLQHHVILVEQPETRGNEPLSESVVQGLVDKLRRDAQTRGGGPVYGELRL